MEEAINNQLTLVTATKVKYTKFAKITEQVNVFGDILSSKEIFRCGSCGRYKNVSPSSRCAACATREELVL